MNGFSLVCCVAGGFILAAGVLSSPVSALDLDLGIAEVGLDRDGLDVGVGVGDVVGADVSVGHGISADATIGNAASLSIGIGTSSTPGTGPAAPEGPNGFVPPSVREVKAARRVQCPSRGNSTVHNGAVVFDRQGGAVGVVYSTWVDATLAVEKLTLATLKSFAGSSQCVTLSTDGAVLSPGGIQLGYSRNALLAAFRN